MATELGILEDESPFFTLTKPFNYEVLDYNSIGYANVAATFRMAKSFSRS